MFSPKQQPTLAFFGTVRALAHKISRTLGGLSFDKSHCIADGSQCLFTELFRAMHLDNTVFLGETIVSDDGE
jgi:hypothetical protein